MGELEEYIKKLEERKKKEKDIFRRKLYFEEKLSAYRYLPEELKKLEEEVKLDPYLPTYAKESFLKSIRKRLGELKEEEAKKKLEYVV
ncbi:MAG: hypothetical protein ACPLYF_03580 [Fervidobacterium sp.]